MSSQQRDRTSFVQRFHQDITFSDLAGLPDPSQAPDCIHRLVRYLQAVQACVAELWCCCEKQFNDESPLKQIERCEKALTQIGHYWQQFRNMHSAPADRQAYLMGNVIAEVQARGGDAQSITHLILIAASHVIFVSEAKRAAFFPEEENDKDLSEKRRVDPQEIMKQIAAFSENIIESIGFLMNLLSRCKMIYCPWRRVSQPAQKSPRVGSTKTNGRGEGVAKLVAALTLYHQYANGSCMNTEPIKNNVLAKKAGVGRSTASDFFTREFKGYRTYVLHCRDSGRLVDSLKTLNGEFSPHELYGRRPPNEDDRDE